MKQRTSYLIMAAALVIGLFIWYKYRQPRFITGETAPDFQVTLADGSTAHLSDTRGKYTLLQFWGSWCGPCRAENPQLVALYNKYHDRGFEIFSVAIEQNPRNWIRAIADDGMIWKYHTMESGDFGGPISSHYNIKSIPTLFLLNPEGKILEVDPMPGELEKILEVR
ncbi:MAG: TlpA family protein disulfide reductase [Saprospiraceae bacterium]|nr:TlpA family protein disulfide reductase [Saprospiraceae bacterium]